jgi:hypothetical protein
MRMSASFRREMMNSQSGVLQRYKIAVLPLLETVRTLRTFQVDEVLPADKRNVTTVSVFSSTKFTVSPTLTSPFDFMTNSSNSFQSRMLI